MQVGRGGLVRPFPFQLALTHPMSQLGLDKELKTSWETVQTLILSARAGMPNNFYHNWTHIADVVQVPPMINISARRSELSHSTSVSLETPPNNK